MSTIDPARQRKLSQAYLDTLARHDGVHPDAGRLHAIAMIRAGVTHLALTGEELGETAALLILLKNSFEGTLKEANEDLKRVLARGGSKS